MTRLPNLFSPIKIRTMELANRAVLPPMGTNLGNPGGTVSEANLGYWQRMAKGGAGLIITEISAVQPDGSSINSELGAYNDRFIPGLKKLADVAHAAGAKIALQLHHAGRESFSLLKAGKAIAPSPIRSLVFGLTPREMTLDEIQEIIASFGAAAARAREAGFDAVEVHGAHGYLLTQFLSALSNHRQDEYGGSLANGSPAGITSAPIEYQPGFNVWRAKKIKEVLDVPVIAVGRFTDPILADEVIGRQEADLIAFGRQFLTDPVFLGKARDNRPADIRICLACNQGCTERLILGAGNIRCAITPETGRETIYPRRPAAVTRKGWVAGAGPGGLTAAYEAARLGHKVTLFEKDAE